ncbi:MAG: hypothetical protein GY767_22730 [Shimia sp.]|nr:hypothetical protein [Shimia sp.]
MQTTGKWGAKTMTNAIEGLSDHRGRKICAQIKLAGLWESPLPAEPKKPRGQAVVKARKKEAPPVESDELPEHPSEYADKTLRWIVSKFSTDARFVDYLKALKEAEATEERMLKNAERRGDLVHRKVVTQGVLEHIDILFKQLLTDCSRTIATRAKAKVEAGESVEELELWVSKQIVGFIQPAKSKIQRTLRANKIE